MFKIGDRIKLCLDDEIKKATEVRKADTNHSLIGFWKSINGRIGIISRIVSEEEIWIRGARNNIERRFNIFTIERAEDEKTESEEKRKLLLGSFI